MFFYKLFIVKPPASVNHGEGSRSRMNFDEVGTKYTTFAALACDASPSPGDSRWSLEVFRAMASGVTFFSTAVKCCEPHLS